MTDVLPWPALGEKYITRSRSEYKIRLHNFALMDHSPVVHGEQPSFPDNSLCVGKFVTFGPG